MAHVPPDRRVRAAGLALLALSLLGITLAAPAQGIDDSPRHYFNADTFEIPFDMSANRNVKQVLLYASTDGKTFNEAAAAEPSRKHFRYTAAREGWHYFIVQVEDNAGNRTPAKIDPNAVDLRVCIDKKEPEIKLEPVAPIERLGTVAVEWEVKDDHEVDLRKLTLEYRRAGTQKWIGLNHRRLRRAQYNWSPREAGEYEVRLTAHDMAGNKAEKTATVRAATAGNKEAAPAPPPGNGSAAGTGPGVIHVRKKTFKLQYKIDNVGPSKVKNVEVWITRDTRQWTKFKDDAPADPGDGYELTVVSTGRWGFTLRPISGVGRAARAPSVNEQPQIWVEVDETAPVVRMIGVVVGEGTDNGTITVNYSATDRWLRERPIAIYYATSKDGEWKPLATGLANSGAEKVPVRELGLFEFYVKVEAQDEAGNAGQDVTRETVKVDLNEPKVTDLKVSGVGVK